MYERAVEENPYKLLNASNKYGTEKICEKAAARNKCALNYVSDEYKTNGMREWAIKK